MSVEIKLWITFEKHISSKKIITDLLAMIFGWSEEPFEVSIFLNRENNCERKFACKQIFAPDVWMTPPPPLRSEVIVCLVCILVFFGGNQCTHLIVMFYLLDICIWSVTSSKMNDCLHSWAVGLSLKAGNCFKHFLYYLFDLEAENFFPLWCKLDIDKFWGLKFHLHDYARDLWKHCSANQYCYKFKHV